MPRQGSDDRTRSESREKRGHHSEELTNLARAALVGPIDDLDRFLKACWQYAYDAARRFGRKHQGAEDSAQDAALAVTRLLDAKPPAIKPETVAAFVSVVVLRSAHAAARRRMHEANAAEQTATARETADAALEVETAEWARRLLDAVDKLPRLLRRIVLLLYWDDPSTRELAREIGRSQRSIIRLLREAKDILRGELRGLDRDDECEGHDPRRRRVPLVSARSPRQRNHMAGRTL